MSAFFDDYFIALLRMKFDGNLIAHRTCRTKKRGFFLKNLRRSFLQKINRRVFAINIVADFRFRHRFSHRGRWFCNCVAS